MGNLVYYVSGHGFGHAVRSAEVIRAIGRQRPELRIHLRTTAPAWLFPEVASYRGVRLDVGVVQPDALHVDQAATLEAMAHLARDSAALAATEAGFLRRVDAGLVVADIPPVAFLAAQAAGRPSVAVANFSWDWIYQPYVRSRPGYTWLLDWLGDAYGRADLLLRLPFHGDLSAFRRIEDVPLVTRPPSVPPATVRARLDLRPDEPVVLLAFGGLGLSGLDAQRLGRLSRYTFLATEQELAAGTNLPPNVRYLPVRQDNYVDLLAACNAVVTKPGFGIVASCLAQQVPLLYTDRGEFAEYDVLVEAIHRFGRGRYIPQSELLAANLGPVLDELLSLNDCRPPPRADGAEVVARRLLALMAGS